MYIYTLHLCIDFQTLDNDKTLDLSIENMRFEDLDFLRTTRRMGTLLTPGISSKYLGFPENIIQACNHMSNDLQQGTEINGPPSVGFSQHFGAKCEVSRNGIKLMSGIDPEPEIYLEILLKLTLQCTSIKKSY